MERSSLGFPPNGSELIMVQVGDARFALDIMSIREIRGWTPSTPLPHAPSYVLGMINLRGAVLPVIDLGARLGHQLSSPGNASVVVVAHVQGRLVGLLVDAVCDILTVTENMIQEPPDVGTSAVREFVHGVMTTDEGIITLLSLEQVLPPPESMAA